jgi:hypothetical protein
MKNKTDFSYSLLTEPWIETVSMKGIRKSVGLIELFEKAHEFERFDFSMPGFDLAVLRFLIALVYIIDPPRNIDEWKNRLKKGKFDESFIEGLKKYEDRLDLFHPKYPFMQEIGLEKKEKVELERNAKISRELPTEKGHLHFCHIVRDDVFICNKCITPMILFEHLFAVSGGRGYKPGINGTPPYYVFLEGQTLYENIFLNVVNINNLVDDNISYKTGWVKELNGEISLKEINIQDALLWKSRQIRLFPEKVNKQCIFCNSTNSFCTAEIIFKSQKSELKEKEFWFDPFTVSCYTTESIFKKKPNNNQLCIWKDYLSLVFESGEQNKTISSKPPIILQQINIISILKPKIAIYAYYGDQATVYQIRKGVFSYNPEYKPEDIYLIKYIISISEKAEGSLLKSILKSYYMKYEIEDNNDKKGLLKIKENNYKKYSDIIYSSLKSSDPLKEDKIIKGMKEKCRLVSMKYWNELEVNFKNILDYINNDTDPRVIEKYWNKILKELLNSLFNNQTLSILENNNYLKGYISGSQILTNFIYTKLTDKGGD